MATTRNREYLGVGWSFPVRPAGGALAYVKYEDDVEQAIGIILETTKRERIMRPSFGAGLRAHVFDSNSTATQRAIEDEVRRALADWEPRITVERVHAYPDAARPHVLLIDVDYVIVRSNVFFNLVYPFYLTEGA